MKKYIAILLVFALLFAGCAQKSDDSVITMRFTDAVSLDTLRGLDGKTVSIVGYMATLSPISGEYMYLMNMPYQSCPFCVPNSMQLSNTMAVYAPKGQTFEFTDQAIRVTGTLKVEDIEDDYGYTYNYRIADATYEAVDLTTVNEDYALWQSIASDGIVAEVNTMFDYVYFLCQWTEYISTYYDNDGNEVTFFLYPGDVENYLKDDGVNGYADKAADTYFPGLVARARAVSATELEDLVAIIEQAQAVADYALSELSSGNYTYNGLEDKYTLNNEADLYNAWYEAYAAFSDWLAKWEV